jgi:hypothetical protein
VVQRGIVVVALVGRQCQAVVVRREGGRGSGGHAAAMSGRQWHNACTVALLGWKGGGGHAAVLVRWQRDLSGWEG